MDFYEPLPEFDADRIRLDFEDRRNGIDEMSLPNGCATDVCP